jgi:hypothetical protein
LLPYLTFLSGKHRSWSFTQWFAGLVKCQARVPGKLKSSGL